MTDRRIELLRALLHIDDTIESMSALAEDPDGGALPPLTRKQPPKAADIYRDSISPETLRHTPPLTLCRPPHDWPDADIEAAVLPPHQERAVLRKCEEKAPPFRAGMNPTVDDTPHRR